MLITKAPKGTQDILPQDIYKWHYIERVMRDIAQKFNFKEIRVPTFEHTELFLRGVGQTTDIVNKEMYTFTDKGDRSITLKPEGTAGVVRAFLENNLDKGALPVKMYYVNSPVFRYERPQKGRFREHHQFGIEFFGAQSAYADAEVIMLAKSLLKELGVEALSLKLNSIGCPVCRPKYNEVLKDYLRDNIDKMCGTCRERFETNPLRILDCKVEGCKAIVKDAPKTVDHLCEECETHLDTLKETLTSLGEKFEIDPLIVRGLDYYTKTVFEFVTDTIGAQGTVCGGGRYDNLIEELGGDPLPAVGFGMGMERLLLTMEAAGTEIPVPQMIDIYFATVGDEAKKTAASEISKLRLAGFTAETDFMERSLKAQMKYANKIDCRFVAILGDEEVEKGTLALRSMETGEQTEVKISEITEALKRA
jgi:histidyl-tRNA synthetase